MPVGSVLMSSRAPIGYCVISANEVSTNQGFKSVVPYVTATNEYLYYYLLATVEDIRSRASGTTFKEISGTEFGNTVVSLPPITEQLRIVSAIEEAYAVLDVIASNIQ
jgi:type I restriction enzyme S subunit